MYSFVESLMLFGMGMTLTKVEDERLAKVIRPAYASLGLANDYFSFDREWQEVQETRGSKPLNAVWLFMKWRGVSVDTAKQLVREAANLYEKQFLDLCDKFRTEHAPISDKLDRYLRGMVYQVSGNLVWSLKCPRYHPEFRYDPNAGIEDVIRAQKMGPSSQAPDEQSSDEASPSAHRQSVVSLCSQFSDSASFWSERLSRSSSVSEVSAPPDSEMEGNVKVQTDNRLGTEVSNVLFIENADSHARYSLLKRCSSTHARCHPKGSGPSSSMP